MHENAHQHGERQQGAGFQNEHAIYLYRWSLIHDGPPDQRRPKAARPAIVTKKGAALRRIVKVVAGARILCALCAVGRPSIAPKKLLRAMLLQTSYSIR
jgi:hypothetical protein